EVSTESFVWRRQCDVRMHAAVDHVAAHAKDVGRCGWVFHVDVFYRQIAARDLMHLMVPHRPDRGQNDRVTDLLLLDHLLQAREQIGVVLETEHDDTLDLGGDSVTVRDLIAVGTFVLGWICRSVSSLAAGLLRSEKKRADD